MKIRIEPHTLLRANERGATEVEIKDTIEHGIDLFGKNGRTGKGKVFDFRNTRNGKFYEEKKVEAYYVMELETILQ